MAAISNVHNFCYLLSQPGTPNPLVSLWVADLADPKNIRTRDLKPPGPFQHTK